MGLLNNILKGSKSNKKAASPKQVKTEQVLYEQTFTQSHTFKRYKRFHVSYNGYEPAERGLAAFRNTGMDLEGAEIHLKYVRREDYMFLDVYVNSHHIGSVTFWSPDSEDLAFMKQYLITGLVEKAHIKIEYENVAFSEGIEKREFISLFLKSTDKDAAKAI